jgi:hypothetical protein
LTFPSASTNKQYDYNQVNAAYKQFKDKAPTNGSNQPDDRREFRHAQPLQSVAAALKTIERYVGNN